MGDYPRVAIEYVSMSAWAVRMGAIAFVVCVAWLLITGGSRDE